MMKRLLGILFLVGVSVSTFSQDLSFETLEHDFGTIKEADGPVTTEFVFTNNSENTIRITNVKASCGCTTPGWTKEEVAPGGTGFIQARYNPVNRPGPFKKSLTATIAGLQAPIRLYITGTVEGRPKSIEEQFPVVVGNLRMKYKAVNFGRIKTTGKQHYRYMEVYNEGQDSLRFASGYDAPHFIALKFEPEALAPNTKGRIRFAYNANGKNDLGYFSDQVVFRTDESSDSEKPLNILATIEEYFPPMTTEEAASAPRLSIKQTSKDLGTLNASTNVNVTIPLSNLGKSVLEIRKITTSCDCITVKKKDTIDAGQEDNLELVLDTTGLKGRFYSAVYIFSNDPRKPTQMVRITGSVRQANSN